jgi:hypothetical protein
MMSGSVVMLVVMVVMLVVMCGGMLFGGLTMRHRHRDRPDA